MPDADKGDPAFLKAYAQAIEDTDNFLAGRSPGQLQPNTYPTGSIGAAIYAYRRSDHYMALAASTRATRARIMEDIRDRYGRAPLAKMEPRHIRQDLARLDPHPANNRLRAWRALGRWWVDAGLIDTDPARDVRKRPIPQSDGHKAWTREDRDRFRANWPHDTAQRLAFEVMYRTGASIGDACALTWGMVDADGWLTYTRQKTGTVATCPFTADAPDWFEGDNHLRQCLAAHPRQMILLATKDGIARSRKAAAQWFSAACTAAGLPELTAHGIRKLRGAMFRENGASADQRMAILGHESRSEAARYSRSADLRRVITGTGKDNSPGSKRQLSRKTK